MPTEKKTEPVDETEPAETPEPDPFEEPADPPHEYKMLALSEEVDHVWKNFADYVAKIDVEGVQSKLSDALAELRDTPPTNAKKVNIAHSDIIRKMGLIERVEKEIQRFNYGN